METENGSLPSEGVMRCPFRFDLHGQTTQVVHVKRAKPRRKKCVAAFAKAVTLLCVHECPCLKDAPLLRPTIKYRN